MPNSLVVWKKPPRCGKNIMITKAMEDVALDPLPVCLIPMVVAVMLMPTPMADHPLHGCVPALRLVCHVTKYVGVRPTS